MIDGAYRVTESGEHEVRFDRRVEPERVIAYTWTEENTLPPSHGAKYLEAV